MFANCNSNSSAREMAAALGYVKVQYGETTANTATPSTKLAFADPASTHTPKKGTRFDV